MYDWLLHHTFQLSPFNFHLSTFNLLKGIGFTLAPFGVELEAYCRGACGEDGALDGGNITTLELHTGNYLAEQRFTVGIKSIDSDIHLLLIGKEIRETVNLYRFTNLGRRIVSLIKTIIGEC